MAETTPITKDEIEKVVWKACDTFRGMIDSSDYKNYILTMLFVKYVSDVWRERLDALRERYGDNEEMIRRQMQRERFQLPPDADYEHLHQNRNAENLGELIDQALDQIEEANRSKLLGVFRKISFNSDNLGEAKDRNRRLKSLLEDLSVLDLRESRVEHDVIGDAYMFLIGKFASGAGKKGGEFYTPPEVSILLGKLLDAKKGNRICDPACGSGSLLIRVAEHLSKEGHHDYSLYGQEANGSTWALCRMNMVLHDEDSAIIEWGDSLLDPNSKKTTNSAGSISSLPIPRSRSTNGARTRSVPTRTSDSGAAFHPKAKATMRLSCTWLKLPCQKRGASASLCRTASCFAAVPRASFAKA